MGRLFGNFEIKMIDKVIYILKSRFKAIPWLYKLWFVKNKNSINSGKIRLPEKGDDWYFDGYPRSGNTFFINLLRRTHTEQLGASHLHCIAAIKIALSYNIKTVVIFRNPVDAVLSFFFTKTNRLRSSKNVEMDLLEHLLQEWIELHQYVSSNYDSSKMILIHFSPDSELIYENLNKVEHFLGLSEVNYDRFIDIYNEYQEGMNSAESKKQDAYSSLPNEARNQFKVKHRSSILKLKRISQAQMLYDKLLLISTRK